MYIPGNHRLMVTKKNKDLVMLIEYRSPTITEYKKLRNMVGWWKTNDNATGLALKNIMNYSDLRHGMRMPQVCIR